MTESGVTGRRIGVSGEQGINAKDLLVVRCDQRRTT